MIRVDFYLAGEASPEARLATACRLAEKAYSEGLRTYVATDTDAQARVFDERLWAFRDGSFVPHALAPVDSDDPSAVVIGRGHPPAGMARQVLINLTETIPEFATEFERIVEVLDQRAESLDAGRQRFRQYRERGLEPTTHRLG